MNEKINPNCSDYEYLYECNKNYMNNIALSDEFGRKVTYEELHTQIFKYAKALRKKGIKRGDKVALLTENYIEGVYLYYALGVIGATRIGFSVYNNTWKANRDFRIVNTKCSATIIPSENTSENDSNLGIIPTLFPNDNILDEESLYSILKTQDDIIVKKINYNPPKVTDILFTGGSTGVHKGVDLNSSGLNNVIQSLDSKFSLEPGMIHLGNIPFGHMIFGRFALHYALCNNLEYALTLKAFPDKFLEELIRTKANGAMGGPIHFRSLQNNPLLTEGCLSELYQTCTGGEMLKSEDEKAANEAMAFGGSKARLINMLGLTEMSGATHINIPGENTPGTIGSPISCVEDIIVDPKILKNTKNGKPILLKEVPVGETGLLLTKGPGMLLGYHKNQRETNKVFVYDQYGNKWYNTGDLVKRTGKANKETAFSGREKRNFVCGCDNIYPEQIEEILSSIPEIKEIVVTKVKDEKYQFLPVYNICLKDGNCITNQLRNKIDVLIEKTLGASALPGYINFTTENLPRNIDNNKFDLQLIEANGIKKIENESLKLMRKIY